MTLSQRTAHAGVPQSGAEFRPTTVRLYGPLGQGRDSRAEWQRLLHRLHSGPGAGSASRRRSVYPTTPPRTSGGSEGTGEVLTLVQGDDGERLVSTRPVDTSRSPSTNL